MYNDIKSHVKLNNEISNEFTCILGVRQGECLSPFLFSMFLNDIENEFIINGLNGIDFGYIKLFLMLYADDIVIFSNSPSDLQKGLDVLYAYCQRWKLVVNAEKTKVMVFRKGGRLPGHLEFNYNGNILEIVNRFTYLGVVFTTGGAFTETQTLLAGQALKATYRLEKYLYKFVDISPKHVLDLFDKLVYPILSYSSEVWGFASANCIERVHTQFCKKVLGVKKNCQNDFVYGEIGRLPCRTRCLLSIVKYWFKILRLNDRKYVKIVYKDMLNTIERHPNTLNWANQVKCLLSRYGFYHVWLFQGVANVNVFLELFKQRLSDVYVQEWNSRLEESSRALFYKNISDFSFHPYLNFIKTKHVRHALTRLRLSSHRLEIETGRWSRHRVDINNRLCRQCNVLEDEYHFVICCSKYNFLRKRLIPQYYVIKPSMFKFIELLKCQNEHVIFNLGLYIYKAFKIRNEALYQN
jgi:hypothetical protein